MKALNKETAAKTQRPERIIQFGEGNFLRAFVDWIIYNMNEKTDFNSSVVVVQPIEKGMVDMLNAQDCLYHVNLQGLDKGPGFPRKDIAAIKEKLQYDDNLVVQAEIFHLWVIEAPQEVAKEFPADKAGLNVLFVPSEAPYHERKVTLLNGPHTVLSPVAYLSGINIVREACEHEVVGKYIHKVMFDELMETLNLPKEELKKFAEDVLERFNNPFVDHQVTSIMLNSFPKYETRDLPGLKVYLERKGELPKGLVLGLAAIITYYKGGVRADGAEIVPNDAPEIMNLLKELWATGCTQKVAEGVLAAESIWGENLNNIPGLTAAVKADLDSIQEKGMLETVKGIL